VEISHDRQPASQGAGALPETIPEAFALIHVPDQLCGTGALAAPDAIRWHTLQQLGTLKINDG
jgi:hypothetical protein